MKINGKEVLGKSFAYDGCHKIYILEDEEDEEQALEYEYNIYHIDEIEDTYENSCPLRFISNWKLNKRYVEQFEENVIFENEIKGE